MSRVIPGPEGVSIAHATAHVLGAADAIDGDQLGITWNPANYTPAVTPAEVSDIDHLTAHLYGIDQALGGAVTDHGLLTGLADDDHIGYVLASGARAMTGALTVPGIVSPGPNSDLPLTPAGSGDLILDGVNWPQADGTSGQVMQTDGAGQLSYISLGAIELARIAGSTYSTVQHLQDIFHSPGWVSGGSITDDGDGTITVAAGTGLIRAINGQTDTIFYMDWAAEAGANVALTANTMHWVYVEYNAGAPRVVARTTKSADFQRDVLLGSVYRNGANVLHITEESRHQVGDHAGAMIRRMKDVAPFARVSGGVLSESGTRNLAITAGNWWQGLSEFTTAALDTSVSGSFITAYQDGGGGWTLASAQTQINNTQYDNGTGALATLGNNQYGVHWVYIENDSSVYVVYGRGDYTLSNAQDAPVPANVPPWFAESHARLLGKVIIQKDSATFESAESVFDATFDPAVPTDHGGLAGLADDDHLQYLPIDGTRDMTGPLIAANGAALLPGVAFAGEEGTGMYRAAPSDLRWSLDGTYRQRLTTTSVQFNMGVSSTAPIVVRAANTNTGLGWPAIDEASIITAASEAVRWDATQNMFAAANVSLGIGQRLIFDEADTYLASNADNQLATYVGGSQQLLTSATAHASFVPIFIQIGAFGAGETVGNLLLNVTAAVAGVQQFSPMTVWEGQGFNDGIPNTSREVKMAAQLETIQGDEPTGELVFKSSVNGSAYFDCVKITSGADLVVGPSQTTGRIRFSTASATNFLGFTSSNLFTVNMTSGQWHTFGPGYYAANAAGDSESAPSIRLTDANAGLFLGGTSILGISTAQTEAVQWDATQNQRNAANIYLQEGNFLVLDADEDTYIYSGGDDNMLLMVNGSFMLEATTNAVITGPTALRLQPNSDLATDIGRAATRWDTSYVQVSDIRYDALAISETVGLNLHNDELATDGIRQQHSPMFVWEGQAWKSAATAVSQEIKFAAQLEALNGTSASSGQLVFSAAVIDGVYADMFAISSDSQALAQDGSAFRPGYSFSSDTDSGMYLESGALRWSIGNGLRMWLTTAQLMAPTNLSSTTPTIAFVNDVTSGVIHPAASQVGFGTAGSPAAIWDATKNMTAYGNILPDTNDANFLGSLTQSWAHIYTQRGITIGERASAPWVHTAGKGQLWVRDDDPCVLIWQDDTDVDHVLTGPGATLAHPDPHLLSDGLATAPAYGFSSTAGLGIYAASGVLRFAVGNGYRLSLTTAQLLLNMATSVTVPALTLAADPNTGLGWFAADRMGIITAGTEAASWSSTQNLTMAGWVEGPNGDATQPTYQFEGTTGGYGMYYSANTLRWSCASSEEMTLTTTQLTVNAKIQTLGGGTANNPEIRLVDVNSGVYRPAASEFGISTGGSEAAEWDASGNMTNWGNILSNAAGTDDIGSTGVPWDNVHAERGHFRNTNAALGGATLIVENEDVNEGFLHLQGTSAANLTNNIVDASETMSTPTDEGFVKVYIQDDGVRFTTGDYYIKVVTLNPEA